MLTGICRKFDTIHPFLWPHWCQFGESWFHFGNFRRLAGTGRDAMLTAKWVVVVTRNTRIECTQGAFFGGRLCRTQCAARGLIPVLQFLTRAQVARRRACKVGRARSDGLVRWGVVRERVAQGRYPARRRSAGMPMCWLHGRGRQVIAAHRSATGPAGYRRSGPPPPLSLNLPPDPPPHLPAGPCRLCHASSDPAPSKFRTPVNRRSNCCHECRTHCSRARNPGFGVVGGQVAC